MVIRLAKHKCSYVKEIVSPLLTEGSDGMVNLKDPCTEVI